MGKLRHITRLVLLLFSVLVYFHAYAQEDKPIKFDDTRKTNWPVTFEEVSIPSSVDSAVQKAMLYRSKSKIAKPLIVSLHTWSGDYTQKDPLVQEIVARDWNYIHPDFRGPNRTPQSMGSSLVLSDIDDAIRFALQHTNADPEDVHIVGVSGGGFATLAAYMNTRTPVKSFSAWAPISDLEAWYWESVGRKQKYAKDILKAVSSTDTLDVAEARRRSPLYQELPKNSRDGVPLYIYEGIHDGYTGSVPITQSIHMYNRLVGDLKYHTANLDSIYRIGQDDTCLVSEGEMLNLVTKRFNPDADLENRLFDRNIYLHKKYMDIELCIFEGTHEQIPQALGLIPVKKQADMKANILVLGDSNAEFDFGWVAQLKKMLPNAHIVNISKAGRTIGFDNLGRKELNALRNIEAYLKESDEKLDAKAYDYVIVCLGTNDTKKVFVDRQEEAVANFEKLLTTVNNSTVVNRKTQCIYLTPPPVRTYDILEKYEGANERLSRLIPQCTAIAEDKGFAVIDVYQPLQGILDTYAADGVHMAASGQEIIAARIVEALQKK